MIRVYSYDTAEPLDGTASPELVQASCAAVPTGAVAAYRDEHGAWQHVPDCDVDHYRRNLRETVVTVYVDGAP